MAKRKLKLVPAVAEPIRIRVGNGEEAGFTKFGAPPWDVEDGSVEAVYSSFHFHRLDRAGRYAFMNECYRALKPGGQVMIIVPHWLSQRAKTDPWAEWPEVVPGSFMVYNANWRKVEQATDLPLTCDFADVWGVGQTNHPALAEALIGRADEVVARVMEQANHEIDRFLDLHVTLTKPEK